MNAHIPRRLLLTSLAAAALLAAVLAAPPARSASFSTCRLSAAEQQPRGGKPTYNLKLTARGTSCRTARRVMSGYHGCRPKGSLRCAKRVLRRWRCSARKDSSTSVAFYATFTCTAGSAAVKGVYQQNT